MIITVEGYDIIEKIGEGGMGQVFRAVHRRLDRPVAIKRLAPHLSHNQDMLRRFLQEARLQARLTHPNVVNIFDLIENDQGIFLVMEYVEGQTARDMLLGRGRLGAPEALMIAEGVLSGLAFMHKNGVVHRDIKPSNIMVSATGTVKVTDFGIARLVNEETGLTRFGGGIGTLHYMAPELIKSGEVSFSIDIYSLGATLHELLSGAPPFTGNTDLEIMMGHLEKPPPDLSLPGDDAVSDMCRTLVAKALAKTPAQRYPSAEAFLAEVRRIRQLVPKSSPESEAVPPAAAQGAKTPDPALDRPTTPAPVFPATSVVPPLGQAPGEEKAATAPPRGMATAAARVTPTPPKAATPAPAGPGKRKLWIGLAAAGLAGVALFLALRPDGDAPAPVPTPTAAPGRPAEPAPPPPAVPRDAATTPAEAPEAPAQPALPVPTEAPAQPAEESGRPPAAAPDATTAQDQDGPPVPPASQAAPDVPAEPAASDAPAGPVVPDAPVAQVPAQESAPAQEPSEQPASPEHVPVQEAPAAPPAQADTPAQEATQQIVYVQVRDARLRERGHASSAVLGTLDQGARLVVLENTGEWIRVSTPDGRTGFVMARLTSSTPPAPTRPQPPARAQKPASRPSQKSSEGDQGWRIVK